MSEYAAEQKRFGDNRDRLKAERLAREATVLANKDTTQKTASRKKSASASKGRKAK